VLKVRDIDGVPTTLDMVASVESLTKIHFTRMEPAFPFVGVDSDEDCEPFYTAVADELPADCDTRRAIGILNLSNIPCSIELQKDGEDDEHIDEVGPGCLGSFVILPEHALEGDSVIDIVAPGCCNQEEFALAFLYFAK
jgi:hypothetical protein